MTFWLIRNALQETRQQARNGEGGLLALAASVAGCILECFYTLIEYLTKFATVMMSITGVAATASGGTCHALMPVSRTCSCQHGAKLCVL